MSTHTVPIIAVEPPFETRISEKARAVYAKQGFERSDLGDARWRIMTGTVSVSIHAALGDGKTEVDHMVTRFAHVFDKVVDAGLVDRVIDPFRVSPLAVDGRWFRFFCVLYVRLYDLERAPELERVAPGYFQPEGADLP